MSRVRRKTVEALGTSAVSAVAGKKAPPAPPVVQTPIAQDDASPKLLAMRRRDVFDTALYGPMGAYRHCNKSATLELARAPSQQRPLLRQRRAETLHDLMRLEKACDDIARQQAFAAWRAELGLPQQTSAQERAATLMAMDIHRFLALADEHRAHFEGRLEAAACEAIFEVPDAILCDANTPDEQPKASFIDWLQHVVKCRVGRKEPFELTPDRSTDVINEFSELSVAITLALSYQRFGHRVILGIDQAKMRLSEQMDKPSFDLKVVSRHGDTVAYVEVTSVRVPVAAPNHFDHAIAHGIKKSRALNCQEPASRELSVEVHQFRKDVKPWQDGERVVMHRGDGTYWLYPRGWRIAPDGAREGVVQHPGELRSVAKDLAAYLRNHADANAFLDKIHVQTVGGGTGFTLRRDAANAWHAVLHRGINPMLERRRQERLAHRAFVRAPRAQHTKGLPATPAVPHEAPF